MPSAPREFSTESVVAYLQQASVERKLSGPKSDSADRVAYLQAAAVLACFDPNVLKPYGVTVSSGAAAALAEDMVPLPGPEEQDIYTLGPAARQQGLSLLGSVSSMKAARAANSLANPGPEQSIIDQLLEGRPFSYEVETPERIEAALHVVDWFEGSALPLPDKLMLQVWLVRRRLLARFERRTANFYGRSEELADLEKFLRETGGPYMLSGIGGVGKSTLLSRFILSRYANSQNAAPFVYLDFDNRNLSVEDLGTLLNEALAQLGAEYFTLSGTWARMREQLQQTLAQMQYAEIDTARRELSLSVETTTASLGAQMKLEFELATQFAHWLTQAVRSNVFSSNSAPLPFLFVLDTYEEVQRRGAVRAARLWRFLSFLDQALQNSSSPLRVIVSGRRPVSSLSLNNRQARGRELTDFDRDSAIALLGAKYEITDKEDAALIYQKAGGNPLSLKLAAKLYGAQDGKADLKTISRRSLFFFSLAESAVQGQLYDRILNHIPNLDLRELAHPGLVVRRVTPEVIQEVLAKPCGVSVPDTKRAKELFDALALQVDLVAVQPDGALRHVPEIRAVMLKLLEQEQPDKVRAIHASAVAYYEKQSGLTARAEQIYHSLQLGRNVEPVWNDDVAGLLSDSIQELPATAQVYLAAKTNTDVDPAIAQQASILEWEQLAEIQARDAIRVGDLAGARKILESRGERSPGSPLFAILATALSASGDLTRALTQVDAGIASAEEAVKPDQLCELVRLRGDILCSQSRYPEALAEYERAEKLAGAQGLGILQLQIHLQKVQAHRIGTGSLPPPAGAAMAQILSRVSNAELFDYRERLHGLFEAEGPGCVPLLEKGLKVFDLNTERAEGELAPPPGALILERTDGPFADVISGVVRGRNPAGGTEPWSDLLEGIFRRAFPAPIDSDSRIWPTIMKRAQTEGRFNEFLAARLAEAPQSQPLRNWISKLLESSLRLKSRAA